jgi:hypothetical protein
MPPPRARPADAFAGSIGHPSYPERGPSPAAKSSPAWFQAGYSEVEFTESPENKGLGGPNRWQGYMGRVAMDRRVLRPVKWALSHYPMLKPRSLSEAPRGVVQGSVANGLTSPTNCACCPYRDDRTKLELSRMYPEGIEAACRRV